jgi:hypothetical protein
MPHDAAVFKKLLDDLLRVICHFNIIFRIVLIIDKKTDSCHPIEGLGILGRWTFLVIPETSISI